MTNKFKEIHSAMLARQNEIVKTYGNNPKLDTPEGKLALVIDQLDTLTLVTTALLKELGDKVE